MKRYPAFRPTLDGNAKNAILSCLDDLAISGNFGNGIKELESQYSSLHNNYSAVTSSNGTSALHLACLALGICSETTVVVPAITNMASFFAPMYQGAKIIACDVDPESGLLDLDCLDNICSYQKVDFVIVVHLYGSIVSALNLSRLANKNGFKIIEDCAEAHFAINDDGLYVGGSFDAGCFSFYANKIISGGEGGMTLFRDPQLAETAKNLKNLAFGDANTISKFYHLSIGYNYRLSNLQASLALQSVLNREAILKMRMDISRWYDEELTGKPYIARLQSAHHSYRVNWVYCIKITDFFLSKFTSKSSLLNSLDQSGIEARDCFYPADHQPFFVNYLRENPCPQSATTRSLEYYKGLFYLPVYIGLTKEDIAEIVSRIDQLLL